MFAYIISRRSFKKTILIFFLLCLLPLTTIGQTTYYVASNGSDTAPYDTWAKAATSIQAAINAASDGDIINAGSSGSHGTGSYTENVTVNKQVTIQSESGNASTTVIASDANQHVFEVTAHHVTIEGFSIYGATGANKSGIYFDNVHGCSVNNCRVGWDGSYKNNRGIHLVSSDTCKISNVTAGYNSGEGIFIESSSIDSLSANTVSNNSGDGISLSSSSNNTFTSNTANSNTFDGFHMVPSSNSNTLNNNTASSNGNNGFLIAASTDNNLSGNTANSNIATNGFYLISSANNNTLDNNTASSNIGNGIRLETSCTGNNITSNTVTHNQYGIYLTDCTGNTISSNTMGSNDGRADGDGIMLNASSYNIISGNNASSNPGDGIEFYESSNNDIINNTILTSGGWGIRINYYSSNNVLSGNTVIGGKKGIVLEESHSTNNVVANNTTNSNSEDGIYLYNSTSHNTIIGNTSSNNTIYGLHLNSSSSNTIYLNNIVTNTSSNVYSENSSTNTWNSPTTIYYDYNNGTTNKGYLGNYYSDGTHTGSNGIGGTYTIANDNDDSYQLINTSDNFSLQAWWLNSDNNMYIDDAGKSGGSLTIANGGSNIWKADQAASTGISFSGSDTWTGQLIFTEAPTNAHTFTVEIGSSTDGVDFTAGGPDATVTGDGSSTSFTFTTDASAFSVTSGNYLAVRITSNDAEYSLRTGGAWSYISAPDGSSDYALPIELADFAANLSNGTVILNWQTATEVNNFGFDIERTSDPLSTGWRIIGFIKGSGTTNSPKNYSFTDNDLPNVNEVSYRLKQIDHDGKFAYSKEVIVDLSTITNLEDDKKKFDFSLQQNYPNPFNPNTQIVFSIPSDNNVEIIVFNVLGKEVATLLNEHRQAGIYSIDFNANNLSSGVYFYEIVSGQYSDIKKMILLK